MRIKRISTGTPVPHLRFLRPMAGPYTFSALGVALLLGVATGVQLGQGTIALINPIHFQGPAIHPRDRGAAIDERQVQPREPEFASFYGWGEGASARALDCGECEALTARDIYSEYYEEPVVIHRAVHQDWDEEIVTPDGEGLGGPELADEEPGPPDDRVERYAYYPIESAERADKEAFEDSE